MAAPGPQREAITLALERLLEWNEISRSPQLSRFLRYIVEQTLSGDAEAIKAYAIAVDVFGRSPDFDPQTDPIVRVQARRLRGLLEQYYAGPGQDDAVEISLPTGRYVPEFLFREPERTDEALAAVEPYSQGEDRQAPWVLAFSRTALASLVVGLGVVAISLASWFHTQRNGEPQGALQPPSVIVFEFQNLAGRGHQAPVSAGLAIELVTDLDAFEDIDVRYGGTISQSDSALNTDFVLTGIVRPGVATTQYSAILTDRQSGAVVWNTTVSLPQAQARRAETLDAVSHSFSLALGSSRGPLHAAARQFLATTGELGEGQADSYLCRVLFDIFREHPTAPEADRVERCIALLPQGQQQEAVPLAIGAALEAYRATVEVGEADQRLERAGQTLRQAMEGGATSAFVWEQQAWVQLASGHRGEAADAFRSSLQLNPASLDALAAYARILALNGDMDEARLFSADALSGADDSPDWYFSVPALAALARGDAAAAVEAADRYARTDQDLGPVLAIMAGQMASDSAVIDRYLPQILDGGGRRPAEVLARLRKRIGDEALLERISTALQAEGVPVEALVGSR